MERRRQRGRGEGDRNSRRTGNCGHSGKKTLRKRSTTGIQGGIKTERK